LISIFFRPDRTEIVQGSLRKNLTFIIEDYAVTEPALSYIENEGAGETANLVRFFDELKNEFDIAGDDIYVVLPDYLFSYIESVDYINEENLLSQIQEHTQEDADSFYISMPVSTTSPAPDRQSVYAIRKIYVDKIVEVCMNERIALSSIEPASLGFFRAFGNWHDEMPLIMLYPDQASIVTYSPAGGIFMSDAPDISINALKKGDSANSDFASAIAANDYTAGQTFMNVNTDMPYYVLTNDKEILGLSAVDMRKPEEKLVFPEFIDAGIIPEKEQGLWMPAVGTLLQIYDELSDKDSLDNPLYDKKDYFINVKSGNLLPELAKQASKNRQWRRVIERVCKKACVIFGVISILEIAAIVYFSSYEINPSLEADYEQAQKDMESINHEVSIIEQAKKVEQRPVEAYKALVHSRPDGVGFTSVKIGNADEKPPVEGDNTTPQQVVIPYVKVTAVSGNPILFQEFRNNLEAQRIFLAPSINSISAQNGYQSAEISTRRGGK